MVSCTTPFLQLCHTISIYPTTLLVLQTAQHWTEVTVPYFFQQCTQTLNRQANKTQRHTQQAGALIEQTKHTTQSRTAYKQYHLPCWTTSGVTAYGLDGGLLPAAERRPCAVLRLEHWEADTAAAGCEGRTTTCWPDGIRNIVDWLGDVNINCGRDKPDPDRPEMIFWPPTLPGASKTWAPAVLDTKNLWPPISSVRGAAAGRRLEAGRVWETDVDDEVLTDFWGVMADIRCRRPSGKRTTCWPGN